jgi:hypothetical protein
VIDLAWSRDDSMMASVGLDNSVHIWDGQNFGKSSTVAREKTDDRPDNEIEYA